MSRAESLRGLMSLFGAGGEVVLLVAGSCKVTQCEGDNVVVAAEVWLSLEVYSRLSWRVGRH